MNDVYDVIDALRKQRHLSGRMLASLAGMPATTYTTIMTRRPAAIQKKHLMALAGALEVEWYDLLNVSEDAYPGETKLPSKLSEVEMEEILSKLTGLQVAEQLGKRIKGRSLSPSDAWQLADENGISLPLPRVDQPGEDMEPACDAQYRRSIIFMLDRLNTEGLLEAMHQVLTLTRKPEFHKKECKTPEEEERLMRKGME